MHRRFLVAWSGFQFEMLIALVCVLTGFPLAIGLLPTPNAIDALLPEIVRSAWGISLTLGGAFTLGGILWRYYNRTQFLAGLYLERAGLGMLGAAVIVYVTSIALVIGVPSIFSSSIYGAFVAACYSRSRSIGREIRIIKEYGSLD